MSEALLRLAWRRSDGPSHGRISEYRHDALGREVSTRTWWEMARRCYLDTRFELDIDTDFDGDGNKLKLVDGGMTSDRPAPIGQLGQRAAWSSRINLLSDRDSHYFDFLIDVPALPGDYGDDDSCRTSGQSGVALWLALALAVSGLALRRLRRV